MGLRVLDDDRPGFALLEFTGKLDQPQLSLSVRSLREGTYLGPEGKWQKAQHFFPAERVEEGARTTSFRVGPEVVNHVLEHERIEIATADGALRETTLWENAVPQMPGQSTAHSIYRSSPRAAPVVGGQVRTPPVAEKPPEPPPPAPEPAPEPPPPVPEPEPEVAVAEPVAEPAPPPPPPPEPVRVDPPPPPKPLSLWLIAIPALLLLLTAGVILSVESLRCKVLGISCEKPAPTPAPRDLLAPALACAAQRQPCDVPTCFTEYRASAPNMAQAARDELDRAAAACRLQTDRRAVEARVLQSARQCASGANSCVVKNCYSTYLAEYGNLGVFAAEARAEIARAEARCTGESVTSLPLSPGTYNAVALRGCDTAAQFGIYLTVTPQGAVSWLHQFRGDRYTWSGTINAQGDIRASVANSQQHSAAGRYSDSRREIEMRYSQCLETITLSIIGRIN